MKSTPKPTPFVVIAVLLLLLATSTAAVGDCPAGPKNEVIIHYYRILCATIYDDAGSISCNPAGEVGTLTVYCDGTVYASGNTNPTYPYTTRTEIIQTCEPIACTLEPAQ